MIWYWMDKWLGYIHLINKIWIYLYCTWTYTRQWMCKCQTPVHFTHVSTANQRLGSSAYYIPRKRGGSVGFTSSGFLDSFTSIRYEWSSNWYSVYSKLGLCLEDESKSTHIPVPSSYTCVCFQSEMIYKRMETASVQWAVETVATQGGHTASQQEPLKIPWKKWLL